MLTTMPETSDGSDTFHGMGISQFVTPGTKKYQPNSQNESYTDRAAVGRVPVYYHKEERVGMTAEIFDKMAHLQS